MLLDLFKIFENILIDISNQGRYKIKEKSIKITESDQENKIEIDYKICNEPHFFDLFIRKDTILLDYDTNKQIVIDSYNFKTLYSKLKKFIESETFSI